MNIRVKVISQSQAFDMDISKSDSVLSLKKRIALLTDDSAFMSDTGLETNNVILYKGDKILSDNLTIEESGVESGDVITIHTQAACAGYFDLLFLLEDLWPHVYPVLDQIGTIMGVSCGVIGFGKWLMNKFQNKYKPSDLIGIILADDTWNHFELSNILGLNKKDTKYILKGLGYEWNSHTQLYCASERTQEVFRKLYTIKPTLEKKKNNLIKNQISKSI